MNPGQVFDGYQIIRVLGRGSMGTVYLAIRLETGLQVALKIVNGGPHDEDKERLAVEETGAKLQQQLAGDGTLTDPRMTTVYRVFHPGDDLGIEMEYVEGEDLYVILQRGPLDAQTAAGIAFALCDMLDKLVRVASFVHGDLKPGNVRIMADGQVKVFDFGIAKALQAKKLGTWNPWQSAPYCSPERLQTNQVDLNSDLWSIGVMLYEMVAGRKPFPVPNDELIQRFLLGPDPLPSPCPAPLRNIIFCMLARNPAERYHNSGDCAADLRRFLNHEPVLAADPDAGTRRTVPPVANDATRRTAPPTIPPQPVLAPPLYKREPWHWWMPTIRHRIMAAVLLALVLLIGSQYRISDDAGVLRSRVDANKIAPAAAWTQYKALDKRTSVLPVLHGLRQSLKAQLVQNAQAVIEDYRREQPTMREGDWSRAATDLGHALELDPGDKSASASLALCEGHLLTIRSRNSPNRQRMLNNAISKFEDAEKAMPNSMDPYLGLARIYFYDLHEYEKGVEMIENASKRGHSVGRREKGQMADSLRDRGVRLYAQSQQLRDMPDQRKQYLQKAHEDFQSAARQYATMGELTPKTNAVYADVLRRVAQVEQELGSMDANQTDTTQQVAP